MKKYIVCDIDGTIAKMGDRKRHLLTTPKNWDAFYEDDFDDEVIQVCAFVVATMMREADVIFCTGRKEKIRQKTSEWLEKHFDILVCGKNLLMRQDDDNRSDTVVKPELLKNVGLTPENVMFCLEDRASVTKAYRDAGFTVWQVAEGNY